MINVTDQAQDAGAVQDARDLKAPQGTLGIVFIYLAVTAALWFYVYVITVNSGGL